MITTNRSGDSESPWKMPSFIDAFAYFIPSDVSTAFHYAMLFLSRAAMLSAASTISMQFRIYECCIMSYVIL